MVIMGRREKFLSKAVDQLRAEGISASFFAGDVRYAPALAIGTSSTQHNCIQRKLCNELCGELYPSFVPQNVLTSVFKYQ